MARSLKNLVIDEVSSVDRGAGEGVRVLLMKRDTTADAESVILDFNAARAALAKRTAPTLDQALEVLKSCVEAIKADASITDKKAAVAESVKQFHAYVAGLPADQVQMEKAMTPEEIAALVAKSVTEAIAKVSAPLTAQIEVLKTDALVAAMPALTQSYYKALPDDKKKDFMSKDKKAQDDEACAADTEAKKRAAGDPMLKALSDENTTIKKQLADLVEKDTVASFRKQAVDLGLPEAHGEIMRKAYSGDAGAIAKHNEMLKGMADQIKTGTVFAEFGTKQNGSVAKTAYDELKEKATELAQKSQGTDKPLTFFQAFDKVYTDPLNVELAKKHDAEEVSKRNRNAAA